MNVKGKTWIGVAGAIEEGWHSMRRKCKMKMVHAYLLPLILEEKNSLWCRGSKPGLGSTYQETPGPHCTGYKREALTQEEKNILLKKHNDLRRTVALGRETRGSPGPQPPASDMSELVLRNSSINYEWDFFRVSWTLLTTGSSIYATRIHWTDHDGSEERFAVGQNYASSSTTAPTFLKELEVHVQRWYDEVKDVAPDTVNKFPGSSTGIIGHYTQLVWAQTKYVGCGRTFYEDNGKRTTTLLCNYGPAGNFLGSKLYRKGKPCSACKEGATCNDGLCSLPLPYVVGVPVPDKHSKQSASIVEYRMT
ncbi:hypothetical protein ANN_18475 [Periplaneta americana]|uniref:SCP domain-containing protein n=1 Tax=Periplaneta americana TaxID=6978 RepID=A0ABQ8SQ30_PERAM|nr:hypothetical protein ANN_18475 [Periplaneta americana]